MFDELVFTFMMEVGEKMVIHYLMDHSFTRRRRGFIMLEGVAGVEFIKTF